MLLEGVHVPLTTPFYPDGRVYLRKLEHNLRRYSLTPVSGLIVLATNGEAAALSDGEKRDILRTAAETCSPEKVLTAGISEAGVLNAVKLAEYAAEHRFDTVLLHAPETLAARGWHEGGATAELLTWFRAVADGSPLPVVLASEAAGRQLPVPVLAELATHANVVGVLETSAHIGRVAQLRTATLEIHRSVTTTVIFTAATERMLHPVPSGLPGDSGAFVSAASLSTGTALATAPAQPAMKTRTKQVGLQILWGRAADATEAFHAGAGGLACDVSAAVPQAAFEIWAAWKDGDEPLMREKQARVAGAEPFFLEQGIAAVKAGAELSGYFGGRPRLPLLPLVSRGQQELAVLLNGMRS